MLTSEAANPSEGPAASQAATGTPAQAGEQVAAPQQATQGQTPTEGQAADGTGDAAGEQDKPAEKAGAPEKYEFKAEEGRAFDPKVIEQFSEVARELDLPQDAAQKILDKMAPTLAARQAEALEAARADWADTARTDKEFGGDKLNENLAVAKKALDQFGTPELRTLLNESGLGNHPEVIRVLYRAGKAISEDRFVGGSVGGPPASRDAARALYPSQ
jgi:hypothetical protein